MLWAAQTGKHMHMHMYVTVVQACVRALVQTKAFELLGKHRSGAMILVTSNGCVGPLFALNWLASSVFS